MLCPSHGLLLEIPPFYISPLHLWPGVKMGKPATTLQNLSPHSFVTAASATVTLFPCISRPDTKFVEGICCAVDHCDMFLFLDLLLAATNILNGLTSLACDQLGKINQQSTVFSLRGSSAVQVTEIRPSTQQAAYEPERPTFCISVTNYRALLVFPKNNIIEE